MSPILGEGQSVLFYNHSHTDRFPLHMALSVDEWVRWSEPLVLAEVGEFPAAIVTADGLVHVTYAAPCADSEQRRIKHVIIDPGQLGSI